ncbi:MAG: hypothetical protein IPJ65_09260 [Archangiaceae bacterium]|nr:hypothetical protein [Archangiaceae bacterium]
MTAWVLWLSLAAAPADTMVKTQVGDLSIKLPQSKDWKSEETAEANGKTRAVSTKDGEAQIDVSVFAVDPRRDAKLCVEQLLKALGPDGYEELKVGGQPAYKKLTSDYVGEGEEAKKSEANKVNTVSYVGCNGQTKWVMSMTSKAAKAARFGAVLKRVVDSISYGEAK